MNSLRKSSKSLKRFINTKAKDHGIKVPRGRAATKKASPIEATLVASSDETIATVSTEDKKAPAPPKAETKAAEVSAAKPKTTKKTAEASKTTPTSSAGASTVATKLNRTVQASKTVSDQPVVANKKTVVRKKVAAKKGTNAENTTKRTTTDEQSTAQSTTKPKTVQQAPAKSETKVDTEQKTSQSANVPAKQTIEEANTKSQASKQPKAPNSIPGKASRDISETTSVQSKVSLVKQRAAAMEQPSTKNAASTKNDGVQASSTNAVNDSPSVQSKVSSVKQRAAALQKPFESIQNVVDAAKASTASSGKVNRLDHDENAPGAPTSPDPKLKLHSTSSITSVTASVQSNTSRGSPVVKAQGASVLPPQRSYSSSIVSLNRSGSGLPPRATKLKPTLRSMIDHDETSTIATTFTTPISYVEFSAEDESKLHLPNDVALDATMKLLMCDLQSSEAETVQKAMEALRATDAKALVDLQSAPPILIAMRRWLKDANIQITGLQMLDNIASEHLEFCQTAVTYGALQICLAALQNHPRHSLVQKHACGALVQLVVADAHTFVLKLGGVEVVTKTAVPHAPKFVVFLLQYLSYWEDDFKAKLVRDGGLQALAEIVEGSSGNLHKAAKSTMQRLL